MRSGSCGASHEQVLSLPARQHSHLIHVARFVHLKTEKLTAALQHPVKQGARRIERCDFHRCDSLDMVTVTAS